jgi:hypothetical protein
VKTSLTVTKSNLHPDFQAKSLISKPQHKLALAALIASCLGGVIWVLIQLGLPAHTLWYIGKLCLPIILSAFALFAGAWLFDRPASEWKRKLSSVYANGSTSLCRVQFTQSAQVDPLVPPSWMQVSTPTAACIIADSCCDGVQQQATFFTLLGPDVISKLSAEPIEAKHYRDDTTGRIMCIEIGDLRLWRSLYSAPANLERIPAATEDNKLSPKTLPGAHLEYVVKQASLGLPWEQCCSDLMAAGNITSVQVRQEVRKRAHSLVFKPLIFQVQLWMGIGIVVMFSRTLNFDAVVCVLLVAWTCGQLLYHLLLIIAYKLHLYLQPQRAVLLGTLVSFIATATVVFMLLPVAATVASILHSLGTMIMFITFLPAITAVLTKAALSKGVQLEPVQ